MAWYAKVNIVVGGKGEQKTYPPGAQLPNNKGLDFKHLRSLGAVSTARPEVEESEPEAQAPEAEQAE